MPLLVKRTSTGMLALNDGHARAAPDKQPPSRKTQQLQYASSNNLAPDSALRPLSDHGQSTSTFASSRLSHELLPDHIAAPSTGDEGGSTLGTSRPRTRPGFNSLMNFRNCSESHLAARAALEHGAYDLPPVPTVTADNGVLPKIVKTAPTMDHGGATVPAAHEEQRNVRPSLFKRASTRSKQAPDGRSGLRWRRGGKTSGLEDLHRLSTMHMNNNNNNSSSATSAPPSYGDESNSALAVPVSRPTDPRTSESSRSDGSNEVYASTTTTTHTVSTHTTFFKLPRRNKNRNSLFPLPVKIPPPNAHDYDGPTTPRASTQSNTPEIQGTPANEQHSALQRRHTETSPTQARLHANSALASNAALPKTSLSFADLRHSLDRRHSHHSNSSVTSSPLHPPMGLGMRAKSPTASSFGQSSRDVDTPPPLSASGRNSSSTTGRSSLGGFLSLSRFRQGSEPHSPRHGSPGTRSKSNSFAISRDALVIPEREDGDTPGKYLERLESAVSRSVIATILSISADPFSIAVLRSYTRRFSFFGEPIDMSLRKFLLHAELPKETQQVDRVVQAFADRYHECNPGIFPSSEVAYVIAFSIMMLHTDAFNKNVKRKMTKQDYIKNIRDQGISGEILSCIYDNICYTPFVHFDEDVDINGQKVLSLKPKNKGGKLKSAIPGADAVAKKPSSGPLDPYNMLMENRLDELRPPIKDAMMLDDPYDYRGSQGELDMQYLQRAFTHTGVLQIISARSRPAAYESQIVNGAPNPTETQQGIVDLNVTKVGILWRKSAKRSKTKRPWREWGAILTGSQLYLFKNSHWAKGLVHQFKQHQKPGQPRMPVVFKPPLQDFKPDALIKTDDAVALVDSSYDKHKNAFVFVRTGAEEETLLADNESDLNEWLGLINYAAAFRAAGVRIRGMIGNEEDIRNRDLSRLDSTRSTQTRVGEVALTSRGLSPALQKQVMAARRQIMLSKITDLENQVTTCNRELERILRDARHLQVLAPIADKTRDDVRSAGGRINAAIIWRRRDVWRMKCHRDIIAMDVRLDGYTEAELAKLAYDHAQQHAEAESAKEKPKMLPRSSSQRVRSPPQSPATILAKERPSTAESVDTIGRDMFKSPSGSTDHQQQEGWHLPPLSLDVAPRDQHRPCASSTLLSTPASKRAGLTHSSSTSSVLQIQRTHSSNPPETSRGRHSTAEGRNLDEKDLQLLARSSMGPTQDSSPRMPSIDNPQLGTSPESKHKGVRRSLQKTLRDGHHRDHTHRHRRNKDSESTVRSGGQFDKDTEEATPVLQRDKPRFILHGKQASVVQFGGDWDRMRMRREQYDNQHPRTPSQSQKQADEAYNAYERRRSEQLRDGTTHPSVQDFRRHGSITEDDDDAVSVLSGEARSYMEDAEAAIAYSSGPSASLKRLSSSTDERAMDSDVYDLADWDDDRRRRTVIGPSRLVPQPGSTETQRHRRYSSLEKDEEGNVTIVENSDEEGKITMSPPWKIRKNRRTVIGPSSDSGDNLSSKGKIRESASLEAAASRRISVIAARGGSSSIRDEEFDSEESVEGEGGFIRPMTDEELREMSSGLRAVRTR